MGTPIMPVQNMPTIEHLKQLAGELITAHCQQAENPHRAEKMKLKEYLDKHNVQASFLVKVIAALDVNHEIF